MSFCHRYLSVRQHLAKGGVLGHVPAFPPADMTASANLRHVGPAHSVVTPPCPNNLFLFRFTLRNNPFIS